MGNRDGEAALACYCAADENDTTLIGDEGAGAGCKLEWWPRNDRNGGRIQTGSEWSDALSQWHCSLASVRLRTVL